MTPHPSLLVTLDPANALAFNVVARDGWSESRHRVSLSPSDAARYCTEGVTGAECVRAAVAFLLDREPKESIWPEFDISVIRRYFPGFDEAFPAYLARF